MSFLKGFFSLCLCFFLTGCSERVLIVKPIDVSLPNQSAIAKFKVSESVGYRVALLFVWGESRAEMDRQRKLWGKWGKDDGVLTPVRLRGFKDEKLFFDEVILAGGIDSGQSFEYEGKLKATQVRDIKHFALSPGVYSFEVLTLEKVEAFRGTEAYVEFSYYDPKI